MKYSGRRSYAFLALTVLEKGTTVKNEARFWSRVRLQNREQQKKENGKYFSAVFQTRNFSASTIGSCSWILAVAQNSQLAQKFMRKCVNY